VRVQSILKYIWI